MTNSLGACLGKPLVDVSDGLLMTCDIRSREVIYCVRHSANQRLFELWLVVQWFGFEAETDVPVAVMEGQTDAAALLWCRVTDQLIVLKGSQRSTASCLVLLLLTIKPDLTVRVNRQFALDHKVEAQPLHDDIGG
jgi:hypothetical protein